MERLLATRAGVVVPCARVDSAMQELRTRGADLILAPAANGAHRKLTDLARAAGLEVPLLFRPAVSDSLDDRIYLGRARFGTLKLADQVLAASGTWWYLRTDEATLHDRYRKLINRFDDGYLELGPDDTIRWANAVLRRVTGLGRLEGHSLEELVEEGDAARWRAVRDQQAGGVIIPFLARLKSGRTVEIDPTPRFDDQGAYLGSSVVVRGIDDPGDADLARSRALVTLYGVASALSEAFDLSDVLNAVLEQALKLGGLRVAGVILDDRRQTRHGEELRPDLVEAVHQVAEGLTPRQNALVVRDLGQEKGTAAQLLAEEGYSGLAVVAIAARGRRIGKLWVLSEQAAALNRETVSFMISIGAQAGVAVENARFVEARFVAEVARRQVYRQALQAVTGGKLILCEYEEIDREWATCGGGLVDLSIDDASHVPRARRSVEQVMFQEGFTRERCSDLALCVSEAATNVVKYGPPGRLRVCGDEDSLAIRLDDSGPGIDFAHLSGAVLQRGYSTAPSLGLGYSILLELTDSVHLATGDRGTVLVLEVLRKAPDPLDVFTGLLGGDNL